MVEIMAIPFPDIDPVALALGPVTVRWYGLAYLAGLVLGWLYMRRLLRTPAIWRRSAPMTLPQADDFLLWATLGTVIGGRLGFILLYEPTLFIHNPAKVFVVWEGGMAFHGGFLGVFLAVLVFARINRVPLLSLGDLCAAVVPFGLFFGRIANFINGEIYGRLTNVPWAVDFPPAVLNRGDMPGPRHPTQLYEAFLEGIVMFAVLRYFTHTRLSLQRPGLTAGLFLAGYGMARIAVEYFKQWDYAQFFTTTYFSEGMVYSLPMVAAAAWLIAHATRQGAPVPR